LPHRRQQAQKQNKSERALDRAIEDYNKAIELDPEDAEVYKKRGLAYGHTI